jgi:CheY-like chemotaxis protein
MKDSTNPRIAIIDDSPTVRLFTSFLLTSYGFDIAFEAENGKECIEQMNKSEILPQLVIMDIEMPVMDGFEVVPILKSRWPEVKIIALSDKNDQCSIDKVIAAGADFFLTKEKEIRNKLIDNINELLNLQPA